MKLLPTSLSRSLVIVFVLGILVGTITTSSVNAAIKGSAKFVDVPFGAFYDDAVGELSDVGIIRGTDATHFSPNKPATRGEIAVLLKRLRDDMRGISQVPSVPQPVLSSRSSTPSVRSSAKSSSSSSKSSSVSSSSSSSSSSVTSIPVTLAGGVRFTTPYFTVDKNGGNMRVTVVRIGANQGTVTVTYTMSGGTAIAGKDFTPSTGTLTFAGKETSKAIMIPIFNNSAAVGNPVINLALSGITGGATLLDPSKASVTILYNSSASSSTSSTAPAVPINTVGTFNFSASQYGAAENISSLTVTVVRSGGSNGIAAVNYASADGTAKSGADYTAVNGSLTFAAGETTKTFVIPVASNTATDGNRKFSLTLSSPSGGSELGAIKTADVTVIDDETAVFGSGSFRFSNTNFTASRTTQNFGIVYVTRINSVAPISVGVATNGGTALPGSDYDATTGTLSFAAGELTKPFFIPIRNSSVIGTRAVSVILSNPSNGATITDPTITQLSIQ
ncbi:MAG: S-layer homology domain-containing protein [Candidatus Peribacteraceae bacterium]|nr:S-layer homology domain-containing protein [Candidatus Peribacteraceae bacterium]